MQILYVAIGGAIGAMSRYLIGVAMANSGNSILTSTTLVNLIGCFVMGILFEAFRNNIASNDLKIFIGVGILGAFTTFSAFSQEAIVLIEKRYLLNSIGYISLNLLGSLLAVFLGIILVKNVIK